MYRIYPCITRIFFRQILPLKSRCAFFTEPFVFMLGNFHNNTKSAKSNNSQFYATSRNISKQKVCLALYISSVHVRQWHHSCNLFTITIENLLHFLEYFDDKVNSPWKVFVYIADRRLFRDWVISACFHDCGSSASENELRTVENVSDNWSQNIGVLFQ